MQFHVDYSNSTIQSQIQNLLYRKENFDPLLIYLLQVYSTSSVYKNINMNNSLHLWYGQTQKSFPSTHLQKFRKSIIAPFNQANILVSGIIQVTKMRIDFIP